MGDGVEIYGISVAEFTSSGDGQNSSSEALLISSGGVETFIYGREFVGRGFLVTMFLFEIFLFCFTKKFFPPL